jgi:hypothetical protein
MIEGEPPDRKYIQQENILICEEWNLEKRESKRWDFLRGALKKLFKSLLIALSLEESTFFFSYKNCIYLYVEHDVLKYAYIMGGLNQAN